MDLQLNTRDTETLGKLNKIFVIEISKLKEKQLLLEKHESKYNMLIFGILQSATKNIKERLINFMTWVLRNLKLMIFQLPSTQNKIF